MSYTKVNVEDVEPVAEGLHFLRDPLECENLGVSILECSPNWAGKPHDHADQGQEEVYVCVDGRATVTVDGDEVDMTDGDALRLSPDAQRQITTGDEGSRFVLVGAP